jgi:hypothetical protein
VNSPLFSVRWTAASGPPQVALPLGLLSRGHERTRSMGNVAIILAVIAVVATSETLVLV